MSEDKKKTWFVYLSESRKRKGSYQVGASTNEEDHERYVDSMLRAEYELVRRFEVQPDDFGFVSKACTEFTKGNLKSVDDLVKKVTAFTDGKK